NAFTLVFRVVLRFFHGELLGLGIRGPLRNNGSIGPEFPWGLDQLALAPTDSTAVWAIRWSVSQSPPLTPTPPTHSPSNRIGTPPSMAVQRLAPAARVNPSACATSRV